jgi:hypothetical protein
MKNIHILKTDKPSKLLQFEGELVFTKKYNTNCFTNRNQNIYITNDEEIKEGDYFITKTNDVLKVQKPEKSYDPIGKKIILTTDQDLIENGVQAIDEKFLEWFVKNPSCENVNVISCNNYSNSKNECHNVKYYLCDCGREEQKIDVAKYKIIIPKEEPKGVINIPKITEECGFPKEMWKPKEEPKCTCKEHDPYCCQVHGSCPTCIKKEEPKQGSMSEAVKQVLTDMMKSDEDLGLYEESKQQCKDCSTSLQDCTCIEDTIDMKQETLKEVAEKYASKIWDYSDSNEKTLHANCNKAFIRGAKWQQERSYSEKEVLELLKEVRKGSMVTSSINNRTYWEFDIKSEKKWFEQFKKK